MFRNKLIEYSPDGQLLREIQLSLDKDGLVHPWHAIKLTNGNFVVSYYGFGDNTPGVCIVDTTGNVVAQNSMECQLKQPFYLVETRNGYIVVADKGSSRVVILRPTLELERELLSKDKHGLRGPTSIHLDQSNGRIFVADNGQLSIFSIN